jgi:IPT/TIG domain-containing protein
VPPTPGSGTVDIRVVTPLGTSSIAQIDRFTYVTPPTVTGIAPSTGSVCGNTTVVLTGSGLSNVGAVNVAGSSARTFTVDSDTQITVVTSVADVGGFVDDIEITRFLTSSALAPEFANSGFFVGSADLRARTGPNHPGTPSYSAMVQPAVARVTGVAPNQGPTVGAPSAPGQDFTNPAIRITGCGFTGATAVLFGGILSPSFTIQNDAVIFAVPPTPGTGAVDIRVVTPLGTSAITLIDRFTYVRPPTVTGIAPSTGSVCGNTTVVLTGSGFSTVGAVSVDGIPVQSYTINSDTQITALTSVPDSATNVNDVDLRIFLTATAQSPEFANSGLLPSENSLYGHAGASYPGTPTYNALIQPVVPRISAVAPNQGPTIGAPSAPGQDFTNPAIRITGCGFTGATAVLFGLVPASSFTVQDDTVIFVVPPTPGSGTVDIRVVTPLGTSSILL